MTRVNIIELINLDVYMRCEFDRMCVWIFGIKKGKILVNIIELINPFIVFSHASCCNLKRVIKGGEGRYS